MLLATTEPHVAPWLSTDSTCIGKISGNIWQQSQDLRLKMHVQKTLLLQLDCKLVSSNYSTAPSVLGCAYFAALLHA